MSERNSVRHSALAAAVMLLATMATGISSPAQAAADDGSFAARGIGARSCTDIVALLTGPERDVTALQLSAWVAGYLSHANRTTPGQFDVMPIQDIFGVATVVARLCENNPEALVEPVMARVIELMAGAAQTSETELLTIEVDEQQVQIRQAVLLEAQRALIARGILAAGNDIGIFGPRTRAALTQFQESVGLPATGLPDALTLFILFEPN